jgi:AcrR family transcriptional regulator
MTEKRQTATLSDTDAPTRRLILDAAKANLRRYGADKTTVVDIARALGMSHSNVYRFFRSKAELLDAVVDEWLADEAALLARFAAPPGLAGERMERLAVGLLARKRAKLADDAELSELYHRILAARPAVTARMEGATLATFERIIADGIANGEFAPLDVPAAARVARRAILSFLDPAFVRQTAGDPAGAEQALREVVRTVAAGFANRERPPRLGEVQTVG